MITMILTLLIQAFFLYIILEGLHRTYLRLTGKLEEDKE